MMHRTFAAATLLLLPVAAAGFNLEEGSRWARGETLFHIGIPGVSRSGIAWSAAFEDAMAEWNENTSFRFYANSEYRDPCANYRGDPANESFPAGSGDGFNGVDFGDSMCGNELGKGVAAVTLIVSRGGPQGFGHIVQTDIIFNSALDWDVFTGLRRGIDFRRTALHELGHALGLGHEEEEISIMAPSLSAIDSLQPDDILGADTIYGGPGDCQIRDVTLGAVVDDSLDGGDCEMFRLFNGGNDTSFVDTYRLVLARETQVSILMESSVLDSVLILTKPDLSNLEDQPVIDDDSAGNCNARISRRLPAGEYLILANTFVTPEKCGSNTGPYRLTVATDSFVSSALSLNGEPSSAIFTGGASRDGGQTYASGFTASDPISVDAEIRIPREEVGRRASLFVMAVLEDGRRFVKNGAGQFVRVTGGVASLPAFRQNVTLGDSETIAVLNGFRGDSVGVTGRVAIYVGYALDDSREIVHNREPISFLIE